MWLITYIDKFTKRKVTKKCFSKADYLDYTGFLRAFGVIYSVTVVVR